MFTGCGVYNNAGSALIYKKKKLYTPHPVYFEISAPPLNVTAAFYHFGTCVETSIILFCVLFNADGER